MFYELLSCGGWRVATPTRKRIEIRSFSWPWDDGHRGASIVNARNSLFGVHWGMGELRREVFIGGCVYFLSFWVKTQDRPVASFPISLPRSIKLPHNLRWLWSLGAGRPKCLAPP